jgi:hypothetical protein
MPPIESADRERDTGDVAKVHPDLLHALALFLAGFDEVSEGGVSPVERLVDLNAVE